MRLKTGILTVLVFAFATSFAQKQPTDSTEKNWSLEITPYYYVVADDDDQLSIIATADHNKLHLEGRYNYEDLNTASFFAGYRFGFGKKIQFEITPIAGILVGDLTGFAPGAEVNILFKKFDYYAESEYVFDSKDHTNNFFYTWGELAFNPGNSIRFGASYQKTKLYQTERSVQWGPFAQFSFWKLTTGVYYFNPFSASNVLIFSAGISF